MNVYWTCRSQLGQSSSGSAESGYAATKERKLHADAPHTSRHARLMAKYCIPDMGGNSTPDSPLAGILVRLDTHNALSAPDTQYLRDKGLFDLVEFIKDLEARGRPDFRILRRRSEQERRRARRREILDTYGFSFIDRADMGRLMQILTRIERGGRFDETDVVWLKHNDYFTSKLGAEFHRREALFCVQQFERSRNPWEAVNASSHYRKAQLPADALEVASRLALDEQRDRHLKSAICTTRGGAMRDLGRREEALALAERGHHLDPASFHPCTLLGALHYERGELELGHEWFAKAIERGAEPEAVDAELRSIFRRAKGAKKEKLRQHLLEASPERYHWASVANRSRGSKG